MIISKGLFLYQMPCRVESQLFLCPQIPISPLALSIFMFIFDVRGHYWSSMSLKFIFCPYSLREKLAVETSLCTWWSNANAITAWDWTQLWQMGIEGASPVPSCLQTSCCDVHSECSWGGASCAAWPSPQPEQGRTRFCLLLSSVSHCLKMQGCQKDCSVCVHTVLRQHLSSPTSCASASNEAQFGTLVWSALGCHPQLKES